MDPLHVVWNKSDPPLGETKRITHLLNILVENKVNQKVILESCSQQEFGEKIFINPFDNKSKWVDIGGVKVNRNTVVNPEQIPFNIAMKGTVCDFDCPEILKHLRWMMQKELLKQDMFLIGHPGPYRRWLAFLFCELIGRPAYYVPLTRDTSESDLKQRFFFVSSRLVTFPISYFSFYW